MDVTSVTADDGRACAELAQFVAAASRLFDALKLAGLPVTGPGVANRERSALWLNQVAGKMAAQLQIPKIIVTGSTASKPPRKRKRA